MKLHELKPNEGSRKKRNRVGRGPSSGNGKTSGRGQKGQMARGTGPYLGFEGGQTRLFQTLPKRGFTNVNHKEYAVVNLDTLNERFEDGAEVSPETLQEAGIVKNLKNGLKVLGNGELSIKLTVKANKFSQSAKDAIEQAGGTVEVI